MALLSDDPTATAGDGVNSSTRAALELPLRLVVAGDGDKVRATGKVVATVGVKVGADEGRSMGTGVAVCKAIVGIGVKEIGELVPENSSRDVAGRGEGVVSWVGTRISGPGVGGGISGVRVLSTSGWTSTTEDEGGNTVPEEDEVWTSVGTKVSDTGDSVRGIGGEGIGASVVVDRGRAGLGPSVNAVGVGTGKGWIDAAFGEGVAGRTVMSDPEGSTVGCVGMGATVKESGVVGEGVVDTDLGAPAAGDRVAAAGRAPGAVVMAATGSTVGRLVGEAVLGATGRAVEGAAVLAATGVAVGVFAGAAVRGATGDVVGRLTGAAVTVATGAAVCGRTGAVVMDAVGRAVGDGVTAVGATVASTVVISTPRHDDQWVGHSSPLVLAATH